jgi:plasmid stabilization system protein ParE
MYKVVLKKTARTHIEQAATWYSLQQAGLESRFLDEIDEATNVLALNPFFAMRYADVRSFLLKNFPYLLFYRIDELKKTVKILAVLHGHSNPDKWPDVG